MAAYVVPDDNIEILAVAALRLLGSSASATDLVRRFSSVQIPHAPADAAALLTRLAQLGLVRVAKTTHGEPVYVLTVLGQEYADTLAGGRHPRAEALEDLEQLRTEFMSTIAHELRTPLTAVRVCVGLLLESSITPAPAIRSELLENVARSAERMQRLVTDLLDLATFRTGHVRLQAQRFDARTLARDSSSAIAPLMEIHGQSLECTLPPSPAWVYADRRRLEQVLVNLLSNAQKFSPDGAHIRLAVREAGNEVSWSVADRGPGISVEDQAHLFERFFTREHDTAERKAGAGLGLPIALAIAQAHGGTIIVESASGHGSTFTLTIPSNADAEPEE